MKWDIIERKTEHVLSKLFEGTRFLNILGVPISEFGEPEAEMALNMGYFDLVAFKKSNQALGISLAQYRAGIKDILDRFNARMKTSGYEVAVQRSIDEFKEICRKAYEGAYDAGIMRAGSPMVQNAELSDLTSRAIDEMVNKEAEFFAKRLSEKTVSTDIMSTIAERYGASAKAVFWNGLISGSTNDQQFRWQLGSVLTEHCDDCLELAANSPYTKDTLPTVPRAGDTKCLWRCKCSLIPIGGPGVHMGGAEEPGEEKYVIDVTHPDTRQKIVGPVKDDLNDLYTRINKLRVEMVYAPNDEVRTVLAKERASVTKELIDKAQFYNVRVIPNWSAKDIKTLANTFKSKGLDIVESFRQLNNGQDIYVILGMGVRKGIVEQHNLYSASVRFGNSRFNFNNSDRFIGFVRNPSQFVENISSYKLVEGGGGSGNWGHAGRPGKVGGSAPYETNTEYPYWEKGMEVTEPIKGEIPKDEIQALKDYRGFGFSLINSSLRKWQGDIPDEWKDSHDAVARLDSLMKRSTTKQNITVYRGIHIPWNREEKYEYALEKMREEGEFSDDAFISTALIKRTAVHFAGTNAHRQIRFTIDVPKGSHAIEVEKILAMNREAIVPEPKEVELLLPRGSRFKVLDMKKNKTGDVCEVHLRLLQ